MALDGSSFFARSGLSSLIHDISILQHSQQSQNDGNDNCLHCFFPTAFACGLSCRWTYAKFWDMGSESGMGGEGHRRN